MSLVLAAGGGRECASTYEQPDLLHDQRGLVSGDEGGRRTLSHFSASLTGARRSMILQSVLMTDILAISAVVF